MSQLAERMDILLNWMAILSFLKWRKVEEFVITKQRSRKKQQRQQKASDIRSFLLFKAHKFQRFNLLLILELVNLGHELH